MFDRRAAFRLIAAAACALLMPAAATAADFPARPINLVVPYGPGTGSDLIARVVAQYMGQQLNQSVIVQNRPGVTGGVGTMDVVHAEPDGYMLIFGTNATLITTPILYKKMNYDPTKDLTPVALVARGALMLVTRTAPGGAKTLKELTEQLKAKPGTYGSTGLGTNGDIISRLMLKQIGASARLVTYRGSGDSLIGLIQGDTTFVIDTPTAVLPMIKNHQLRPIAVTGTDRLKELPDMPTFDQLGVKLDETTWYGILAPAKTPANVVKVLSDAIERTVKDPKVQERFEALEIYPAFTDGAGFKKLLIDEEKSFGGFIRSTGIKAE
ncbi:MAG TPA: tripartite tricarboxylate transporter substrate binding protein [Stellaceae bacterium]|nr:tripartite tricarboxylate transporter substrate binding protein [Stellaceae bacterium]